MVDADAIAHGVLQFPGARRALVRAFGRGILRDGRPDRREIARRAFRNAASVRRLNAAVHPFVRREVRSRLARLRRRGGLILLDAALLLETGADRWCDAVVFVDAPSACRKRRVRNRGWDPGEWERRERVQWPVARKRARADWVLRNQGSRIRLRRKVENLARKIWSGPGRQHDSAKDPGTRDGGR